MSDLELANALCETHGLDPSEAHAAIELFRETDGEASPFTYHDRFEWEPDRCVRIRNYIEERITL
jgi:hypothetical protein